MEIFSPQTLIVIALVAVLFGGSRLPGLARSLGSAKAEFEKGQRGEDDDKASKATKAEAIAEAKQSKTDDIT